MDLGKSPRDNDLITIFCNTAYQNIQTMLSMGSTAQKALDDLSNNCLISVSVKGSNVSIMDMQDSSTNLLPCDKVPEWNPVCIFNIF